MAILPTDIQILFTNYDIIAYFLNLASYSEHFISIKHRIVATFNKQKKINFDSLYAFKRSKICYLNIYLCVKVNKLVTHFKASQDINSTKRQCFH